MSVEGAVWLLWPSVARLASGSSWNSVKMTLTHLLVLDDDDDVALCHHNITEENIQEVLGSRRLRYVDSSLHS